MQYREHNSFSPSECNRLLTRQHLPARASFKGPRHEMQDPVGAESDLAPRRLPTSADSRVQKTFATIEYMQGAPTAGDKVKAYMQLPTRYYSPDDACMQEQVKGFAKAQNFVMSFMKRSSKANTSTQDDLPPPISSSSRPPGNSCNDSGGNESAAFLPCDDEARVSRLAGPQNSFGPRRRLAAHASFIQTTRKTDNAMGVSFSAKESGIGEASLPSLLHSESCPRALSFSNPRGVLQAGDDSAEWMEAAAKNQTASAGQLELPSDVNLLYHPKSGRRAPKKKASQVSFATQAAAAASGGGSSAQAGSPEKPLLKVLSFSGAGGAGSAACTDDLAAEAVEGVEAASKEQLPASIRSSQEYSEADKAQSLMAKAFGSLQKVQSAAQADIEAKKEKLGVYRPTAALPFNALDWGAKSSVYKAEVDPTHRFKSKGGAKPNVLSNVLLNGLAEQQPLERAAKASGARSLELVVQSELPDDSSSVRGSSSRISSPKTSPFSYPPGLPKCKSQDDPYDCVSDECASPKLGAASVRTMESMKSRSSVNEPPELDRPASRGSPKASTTSSLAPQGYRASLNGREYWDKAGQPTSASQPTSPKLTGSVWQLSNTGVPASPTSPKTTGSVRNLSSISAVGGSSPQDMNVELLRSTSPRGAPVSQTRLRQGLDRLPGQGVDVCVEDMMARRNAAASPSPRTRSAGQVLLPPGFKG